jgi:hypothetical protein
LAKRLGPGHRELLVALAVALSFKVFYSILVAVMALFVSPDPELVRRNAFTANSPAPSAEPWYLLVGVWERFDTSWYIHIAREGYNRPSSVVFFPLYPLLIRLLGWVFSDYLLASLTVTTAASCFLFLGLYKLFSLDFSRQEVLRALVLCGFWPAGFVFFAGYAESVILSLAVWAVYFARTGRGVCCTVSAFGAGAAKAAGAVVAVPLAVLGREWRRSIVFAAAPVAGSVSYFAYLRCRGLPLPAEAYATYWGTVVSYPWVTVSDALGRIRSGEVGVTLNVFFLVLTAACALLPTPRGEYRLYSLALLGFLLVKLAPPDQQQWARYGLLLFPAYANLGRILKDSAILTAVLFAFLIANGLLLSAFLKWSLVV